MNDTISRKEAIDAICKACSIEGDYHKCDGYPETSTWCDELVALRALPSVQPEQKRGKWINDGGLYKCSCCNQLWAEWWVLSKPPERMRKEMPYCPMCGSYNGEENRNE